jgi:hypothetical protein
MAHFDLSTSALGAGNGDKMVKTHLILIKIYPPLSRRGRRRRSQAFRVDDGIL